MFHPEMWLSPEALLFLVSQANLTKRTTRPQARLQISVMHIELRSTRLSRIILKTLEKVPLGAYMSIDSGLAL